MERRYIVPGFGIDVFFLGLKIQFRGELEDQL